MKQNQLLRFFIIAALIIILCSSHSVFGGLPPESIRIDINRGIAEGAIIAVPNTNFDIGKLSDVFDGNTNTLARTPGINPLTITLEFIYGASISASSIYMATDGRWVLEGARTLDDLNLRTGSYREIYRSNVVMNTMTEAVFSPVTFKFLKITATRTVRDDYVHLNEWGIYGKADFGPCEGLGSIDFTTREGVKVIGLGNPVSSRDLLNCLEDSLVKASYPDFPNEWLHPKDQATARKIQDYRQSHWDKTGSDYIRDFEFVISDKAIEDLRSLHGTDAIGMLIRHIPAINEIWKNSMPSIYRQARLKRIIVVTEDVLRAGGGWHVKNDLSYSFWANDEMNGAKGDIPYDIDSRWGIDAGWVTIFHQFKDFWGCEGIDNCKIDYGLLHELTHHIPVGDNYVYKMAEGNDFYVGDGSGKEFRYRYSDLLLMGNDHMTGPSSKQLTAPSSYQIRFFHKLNPKEKRASQAAIYDINHVYGQYFLDNLKITLRGLDGFGIDEVMVLKEEIFGDIGERRLVSSDRYLSQSFDGSTFRIEMSAVHQHDNYPGFYLGIRKGNVILPLYFPRNLLETFYWSKAYNSSTAPASFEFTMDIYDHLGTALDHLANLYAASSASVIDVFPSLLHGYMYYSPGLAHSAAAIGAGQIDNQKNMYAFEFITDKFLYKGEPKVSINPMTLGYTAPATINFEVTSRDIDGTVERVELYEGANKIGVDYTRPYTFVWDNVPAGVYKVKAKAIDDQGIEKLSAHKTITVGSASASSKISAEENSGEDLSAFHPNPVSDVLGIKFSAATSQEVKVTVLTMMSETLCTQVMQAQAGENNLQLSLEGLENGLYLITVTGEHIKLMKRIVVAK